MKKKKNTLVKYINRAISVVCLGAVVGMAALYVSEHISNIDDQYKIGIGVMVVSAIVYIYFKTSQDSK